MPRKLKKRPRGQGAIWEQGGNHWIRWREKGRRQTAKFPTRKQATEVLAQIVADVAAGRVGRPVKRSPAPPISKLASKWLERRDKTHRSAKEDRWRWNKHLEPWFGARAPEEVDSALLRRFIEAKLVEGLSSSTVRLCVLELSALFSDVVELGHLQANPVRALPRATRRLIRSAHDPRTTPFVERLADVRRIFLALPEPVSLAYALGALAGLRNGEVLALRWAHVDLDARRIHVRESVEGPLKDVDSRIVPIQDALHPLLAAWHLRSGGKGRVVQSMRSDGVYLDGNTIRTYLKEALVELKLSPMTWYQATRHTFASQWVLAGHSLEKLREIMGHSTVQVTERYAHLNPDSFSDKDRGAIDVSLAPGAVVGTVGHAVATLPKQRRARKR
jgi:integrase